MSGRTSDILRVVTIKAVGDVVHVFSHIKKTYRVQWIILEGGEDEPPELHEKPCLSPVPTPKSDKRGKMPLSSKSAKSSGSSKDITVARWLPLEGVESAKYVVPGQQCFRLLIVLAEVLGLE